MAGHVVKVYFPKDKHTSANKKKPSEFLKTQKACFSKLVTCEKHRTR